MKRTGTSQRAAFHSLRSISLEILVAMLLGSAGCTTNRPEGVINFAPLSMDAVELEPGPIAVACSEEHGRCTFDKAEGLIESPGEGARQAAGACLRAPPSGLGPVDGAVGVVGFVAAPFAATAGAIAKNHRKLTQHELAACESDLSTAMSRMTDPARFRASILQAASENTRRHLIPAEAGGTLTCARLEVGVEELRLERTGSSDSSFALLIRARSRLLRTRDGALVYELPVEYRSGKALFYDWTLTNALQNVAETGYRKIAERTVKQLFLSSSRPPMLVGQGFKAIPTVSNSRPGPANSRSFVPTGAAFRPVKNGGPDFGTLGVFPSADAQYFIIQMPLTRDAATSEAIKDVESSLDGLNTYPNLVVQLTAALAAVPMSLSKQVVANIRGVSSKGYHTAYEMLSAAGQQASPPEELASHIVQRLAPQTAQNVVLLRGPLDHLLSREGTHVELAASRLGEIQATTALEIHVIRAALEGNGRINPHLAIYIEAEARLWRVSDGQQLYWLPVHYRSQKRSFREWSQNDAQLFRQELDESYRNLSTAVVNQLMAQSLVAPANPASAK